jgi:hypothetical protein
MRAADNDSQRVLLTALSDQRNSYRRWMRPTDIIQQSKIERSNYKPVTFAELFKKLIRHVSKR